MPDAGESHPPYFNHEARQMLIEGSYRIIPSKPVEVGHERQLLVDNHVISDSWGCRRTVHPPEKYAQNPILEGLRGVYGPGGEGTVMFDHDLGRFRLWNRIWYIGRAKYDLSQMQAYYESEDGIHWSAPKLGLVEFEGSRENNLIQGGKGLLYGPPSVIRAPARLAAAGRFIMLYGFAREKLLPGETHSLEQRIARSDDGIHWRDQRENPVMRGRSDTFNNIVYNPERDVFMMYRFASVNSHQVRIQAYAESPDLVAWTQPEVILYPDELDSPMFHGLTVQKYQGVYLGLLNMFYQWLVPPHDTAPASKPKLMQLDLQLAWSHDGREWRRHPERPTFLTNGRAGTYDAGIIMPYSGLIERGDRIFIYYRGDPVVPRLELLKQTTSINLCLATLRRDGFVSLDAPSEGYMLTKPLLVPGGRLHLNAQTEPGGFIRVALRRGDGDNDGDWMAGWTHERCEHFRGDSTDAILAWKGTASLDAVKNRSVRIHFWMHKAKLYSFWFE
ncbi:MAG: hypothetical protein HY736_12510 [Verrucomicrobia bacterium]|nr:hypothetical protein [Verrucomicrobiota bacterium]